MKLCIYLPDQLRDRVIRTFPDVPLSRVVRVALAIAMEDPDRIRRVLAGNKRIDEVAI